MREHPGHVLCLDTQQPVRIGLDEFYISGWFVPAGVERRHQALHVLANDTPALVETGLLRDDVAKSYSDPSLRYCGFVARFFTSADEVEVRVSLANEDDEGIEAYCRTVELDRKLTHLSPYLQWVCKQELACPAANHEQTQVETDVGSPTFSMFCEVSDGSPNLLRSCMTSILRQHYRAYEVLLTESPDVSGVSALAKGDPRIRVLRQRPSDSLIECLNGALAQSRGEFFIIVPSTDELHPSTLLDVSRTLSSNADVDVIYSDEDSINVYGERSKPVFKPGFDVEMLWQENYLDGFLAFRRSELLDIGGFQESRPEFRDWDAVLRLSRRATFSATHIAKLLYHRRFGITSSLVTQPTDFACRAKLHFLRNHVSAARSDVSIELQDTSGRVRVRYKSPRTSSTAIFLRAVDGPFQETMLLPFARQLNGTFYTITGISVHRSHMSAKLDRNVISVIDIPEQVLIFINGPLECVNHFFLEELASQAARREVGIVTGLSLDYRARILHSGLMSKADGTPVDPFAGQLLPDVSDWFHLQAVREVEAISSHFFAIKRELLTDSGALSAVNADRTERFLAEISRHAAAAQLKILVTPFAIASFAYFDTAYTFAAAHASRRPIPANANLVSFLQAAHPTHCSG